MINCPLPSFSVAPGCRAGRAPQTFLPDSSRVERLCWQQSPVQRVPLWTMVRPYSTNHPPVLPPGLPALSAPQEPLPHPDGSSLHQGPGLPLRRSQHCGQLHDRCTCCILYPSCPVPQAMWPSSSAAVTAPSTSPGTCQPL